MRIIAEIPHPKCRISVFQMNQKFIIKLEQGMIEQTYKVSEMDVFNLDMVKELLNESFLEGCLKRFEEMAQSLQDRVQTL